MSELEALASQLAQLTADAKKQTDKKMEAFEALLSEISVALSEAVSALGKKEPPEYGALIEAIKAIKMDAPTINVEPIFEAAKPAVNVTNEITVSPTPIDFKPQIPAAIPPNVIVEAGQKVGSKWRVVIPSAYGEAPREITVERIA